MLLLSVLVCFSAFLQASLSIPVLTSKPKPVKLKYSCMTVIPPEHRDFKPNNSPVILIHGLTSRKEDWHGVLQVLAMETKRRICAVDLRNHGESPWNDEEFDVAAMAEDVRYLMDELKAPKAILLGHSLGGKTAVHLALNYPDRVEKLIIEDMRPNGVTPELLKAIQTVAKMYTELEKDIPQGVTEKEAKIAFFKVLKERLEKLKILYDLKDPNLVPIKCSDGKCQWRTNTVLMETILKDYKELLNESSGRFDGPALFMYGGKSPVKVGDDESNIKKLFPNAKLVEVPEAGHTVHTSQKFMTEVIKFINFE